MSKSCILTKDCGLYTAVVVGKQTRLKVEKEFRAADGHWDIKLMMIPLKAVTVRLTHVNGGTVVYKITSMGKRTTVTRATDLSKGFRINKEATGPATIETGTKPVGLKIDVAIGQVMRMTGLSAIEAADLFDFDAVIAAGELEEA